MQVTQALDVMTAILRAAEHPDIVEVTRYGADTQPGGQSPPGIKVRHQSGTAAMLWAGVPPRDATPVPLPTGPLPPRQRAARILVLAQQLLDVARPEVFTSWELYQQPGVEVPVAAAICITASDRSVIYLRATAASGGAGEPETDPYPDYQIPRESSHGISVAMLHLRSPRRCSPGSSCPPRQAMGSRGACPGSGQPTM